MMFEAGYVCFDLFLDHRVQEVVVAVLCLGGPGFVQDLAFAQILEQLVDKDMQ